jgi:proteic killer suppression protein
MCNITLCNLKIIKNIKHKGLLQLWEYGIGNKLPADQIGRLQRMLEVIDSINQMPGGLEVRS